MHALAVHLHSHQYTYEETCYFNDPHALWYVSKLPVYVCVCMCLCVTLFVSCIQQLTHTHIHTYTRTHTHTHKHSTHAHTHTHTHTNTHTHTHTRTGTTGLKGQGKYYCGLGYNVLLQDMRGRYQSEGNILLLTSVCQ